jgi:hypothetical protein
MIIYSTTYTDTASSLNENIAGCLPDALQPFLFHVMMKRIDYSMWFDGFSDRVYFHIHPSSISISLEDTDCNGIDMEYSSSFSQTKTRVDYDKLTQKLLDII